MTTIKFRRDTSANWTSVNPIPAQGEPCYETDTGKLKIGNGSDNYVTLPYVSDGGGSSGDLPIATATTLGGVKIGDNLSITEDGTLSATGGSAGTTDYTQLENKPQINSVELTGNKTLNDLGIQPKGNYLTALPDNAVTTDTDQTIEGVKRFTSRIESNNINMGGTGNVTLNGGAIVINQSTTGDTYPSRIFRESNCITIKNGIPNTITSSDFFAIVDRSNNKVLSVNSGTGVTFTNNNGESYRLLTSHDLSNFIDTNYLEWNSDIDKITIKKDAVAHLAMPSDKYIDLTLGASGATYTAPADGYVSASGTTTAPNGFISISSVVSLRVTQPSQNTGLNSYIVCSKGSNATMYYKNIDITELRFIYAVGAVPANT